ncbi:aspartyl protease family protein [Acidiphilium sp.]|uniref:aspartyl protease family protein n=1 Tax=Acidiphilium sp. TaxID=527 RepID=UPI003CFE50E7
MSGLLWLTSGTAAYSTCLLPSLFLHSDADGIASVIPIALMRLDGITLPMMIDTGMPLSTLAPEAATSFATSATIAAPIWIAGAAGTVTAMTLRLRNVELGGHDAGTARFAVVPVMRLTLPDGTPIAGVIGRNLLRRFHLNLDGASGAAVCAATQGLASFNPAAPSLAILDGFRFAATLDTGSGITNMSRALFYRSGLDRAGGVPVGSIAAIGVNGGVTMLHLYRFARLSIDGWVWHRPVIAVGGAHPGSLQTEIVLGGNFLRAAMEPQDPG